MAVKPEPILFREITLRQLGHMEADLGLDEKVYFISRLAAAGVGETAIWGVDDDAVEVVRRVREAGIQVEIAFYGKVYFPEEMIPVLERAQEAGNAYVCLNGRGADFSLEESGWTRQSMLDASIDAVKQAKARELEISIGLAYSSQADFGYIEEFAGAVEAAGADRIYLPDSLGVASPELMADLTGRVRRVVSIPIEVHCHDDFGLATANALASVRAGADLVEVVVNGQDPERSGIASLDEVAVALELLHGIKTTIKLDELTSLSRLHEEMTGMRVADNKPVVGRRAFNYRVTVGMAGSEPKRDQFYGSPKVVPFDPALVGNERVFMLGKFSGVNEVTKGLADIGLTLSDAELASVIALVNAHGAAAKRAITPEELRQFAEIARTAHAREATLPS